MRKVILGLLLLCGTALAQKSVYMRPVLSPYGQALPNATVYVCTLGTVTGPACTGTSKAPIYTDYTGSSTITQPTFSDSNGNLSFGCDPGNYIIQITTAGGSLQYTDSCSGISGVGAQIAAVPGETVAHAVARLPSGGGCVLLGIGSYSSGGLSVSTPNICLQGSGIPNYNSATAPTALTGGTIIQGPIGYIQGADHLVIRDLGVDVGPTWTNTFNSSVPVTAISISNFGQVVGGAQVQNPIIQNVACLGYSINAAQHCTLVENANGAFISNLQTVFNQYGLVCKCTNSNIDGVNSKGHGVASILIKSDNYAPAGQVNLVNFNITNLSASGDTHGLKIEGATNALNWVNVSNGTIHNVGPAGILVQGDSLSTPVSQFTISNVIIDCPGGSCQDGIDVDSDTANGSFSNISVAEMTNGLKVIAPDGALPLDNFHLTNSSFLFLTGVGIEVYNTWHVSNVRFSNITGNAFQEDNATAYSDCTNTFNVVGAKYAGAGTVIPCDQTIGSGTVTTAGTAVNAGTSQAQTGITITGATATDVARCSLNGAPPATWQTGIQLLPPVVTSNTVTVWLSNPTAGNITPVAATVRCTVTRAN